MRGVIATFVATLVVAAGALVAPAAHAAGPTLTTTTTTVPNEGVTVTVAGAGFTGIPVLPGQTAPSLYIALITKGGALDDIQMGGSAPVKSVSPDGTGGFTGTLSQDAASLDRTETYEIIAWPSRSNPSAENLYARADVVIDWNALYPEPEPEPEPTRSLAPTVAIAPNENATVTVVGSGFTGIPVLPGQSGPSLYIALIAKGGSLSDIQLGGSTPNASVSPDNAGAFTGSLTQTAANLDRTKSYEVIAWPSRSNPSAENLYARADVAIDWDALFPAPELPTPAVSVSKTTDVAAAGETVTVTGSGFVPNAPATNGTRIPLKDKFGGVYVQFGYYNGDTWVAARSADATKWAVSPEDVDTVGAASGGIPLDASGAFVAELTASKVATAPEGARFGVRTSSGSGATYAPFSTFTEISFANVAPEPEPEPEPSGDPKVAVTPTAPLNTGVAHTLTVKGTAFTGPGAANGVYVLFGETSVWSGTTAPPSSGWVAQAHVPASAFTDGAWSTTLQIPAGALDPSKTYQVATSAAHRLSITDRSLDTFTPVAVVKPAEPVASIVNGGASVAQGGTLEAVVSGLPAGATVTAEVHSDPVAIGSFTADPLGIARISWTVPAGFPTGAHTLVIFSGSTRIASIPLTITAAAAPIAVEAPQAPSCVARAVSGASIQWGVKESFRSYITGPIANGSVSGGWGTGSGAFNTADDRGRVNFGGAVSYEGHGGLLALTLSNPRIQVNSASSASLILNVQSKGYNGSPDVNASGVVFATLSLPAASETGSRISWSNASATLTAAGAEAFAGFYSAGTALDPVSFAFPLGGEVPCDTSTSSALAATGAEAPFDGLWLGFGMLMLGVGAFALRRRYQRA